MSTFSVLVTYKFTDHAKECTWKASKLVFMTFDSFTMVNRWLCNLLGKANYFYHGKASSVTSASVDYPLMLVKTH